MLRINAGGFDFAARLEEEAAPQTVAAFRRPNRVTYTVVAFAAPAGRAGAHAGPLRQLLASLRAQRPAL